MPAGSPADADEKFMPDTMDQDDGVRRVAAKRRRD